MASIHRSICFCFPSQSVASVVAYYPWHITYMLIIALPILSLVESTNQGLCFLSCSNPSKNTFVILGPMHGCFLWDLACAGNWADDCHGLALAGLTPTRKVSFARYLRSATFGSVHCDVLTPWWNIVQLEQRYLQDAKASFVDIPRIRLQAIWIWNWRSISSYRICHPKTLRATPGSFCFDICVASILAKRFHSLEMSAGTWEADHFCVSSIITCQGNSLGKASKKRLCF